MNGIATAAPEAAVATAQRGLTQLRSAGGALPLRAARAENTFLAAPHRTFVLGVRNGRCASAARCARPAGWRFIVVSEGEALAAVEVRDAGGDHYVFSELNSGPFVASTVEALRRLEETNDTNDELRLLSCPGLYLEALWLHGASDRFMPLDPAPTEFEAYHLYPEDEFTARFAAKAATAHPDGPALPPLSRP